MSTPPTDPSTRPANPGDTATGAAEEGQHAPLPGALASGKRALLSLKNVALGLGALAAAISAVVALLPGGHAPPAALEATFTSLEVVPDTTLSDYSAHVAQLTASVGEAVDLTHTRPAAYRLPASEPLSTRSSSTPAAVAATATTATDTTTTTTDTGAGTDTNPTPTQPTNTDTTTTDTTTTDTTTDTTTTDTTTTDTTSPPSATTGTTPSTLGRTALPNEATKIGKYVIGSGATATLVAQSTQLLEASMVRLADGTAAEVSLPPACTTGMVDQCGLTPAIKHGADPAAAAQALAAMFADTRGVYYHKKFSPEGVLVDFGLRLTGFYGRPVTVRWSLWHEGGSQPLPQRWLRSIVAYRFTPNAVDESFSNPIWVPEPPLQGRYYVQLVVFDRDGIRRAAMNSQVFALPAWKLRAGAQTP
ncbi:MAG: hypothetical protein QOF77_2269 [Solirubrobacteraceae bacterium]|nr:hypothetical protein [Solirubrobacteraceae bacterium]